MRKHGARYAALESLMEDLEKLEKERREVTEEIDKINDNDEEVRQYITNPDGVIEKLKDLKTYATPQDPQLVRDLIKLYVDRIEIYTGHAVIYYHMGTCKDDQPTIETIYLNDEGQATYDSQQDQDAQDPDSCPLEASMGIPRRSGGRPELDTVYQAIKEHSLTERGSARDYLRKERNALTFPAATRGIPRGNRGSAAGGQRAEDEAPAFPMGVGVGLATV